MSRGTPPLQFRIAGDALTWHTARALEILTDRARVMVDAIARDPNTRRLTVPLLRRQLDPAGAGRLRLFSPYRSVPQVRISARLVVGNVLGHEVTLHEYAPDMEITLIFGARLRASALHLRSAQEARGKSCFVLEARFSALDISLEDVDGAV